MGQRVTGIGLFQPPLNLGEEIQTFHRVLNSCIRGERLDRFDYTLLYRLLCQRSLRISGDLPREYGQVPIRSSRCPKRPNVAHDARARRRGACRSMHAP